MSKTIRRPPTLSLTYDELVADVADAVAQMHAVCGHGSFITGAVYGTEPYVVCRKCGLVYCSEKVMKSITEDAG